LIYPNIADNAAEARGPCRVYDFLTQSLAPKALGAS